LTKTQKKVVLWSSKLE